MFQQKDFRDPSTIGHDSENGGGSRLSFSPLILTWLDEMEQREWEELWVES